MPRRSSRNEELDQRLDMLAQRARNADAVQEAVVSRERDVVRFRDEMREVRRNNHFTQLFLYTVGGIS